MSRSGITQQTLYFFAIVVGTITADGAEIRLRPSTNVSSTIVTLGDVAEIIGTPREVDELGQIMLYASPKKGREKSLRVTEVHETLRLHGIDPLSHRITGSETTRITLSESAKANPDWRENPSKFTKTNGLWNKKKKSADDKPESTEVVVAVRDLPAGHVVREIDVKLTQLPSPLRVAKSAHDTIDVVGKVISRTTPAGEPIDANDLRKAILVKRNELVSVKSRFEGVQVTTEAKSLEEGGLGDPVTVESVLGKQRYVARVVGPQRVEVYASGETVKGNTPAPPRAPTATAPKVTKASTAKFDRR